MQDANDFCNWIKDNKSAIKSYFVTSTGYDNAANFLTTACENMKHVAGTIFRAVLPHRPNKIWVRNASCFNSCCFNDNSFQLQ